MKNHLIEKLLASDPRALSRLMTLVENRSAGAFDVMKEVQQHCGRARTVGVTGPPGAGKSTLVDKLIAYFRKQNRKVGVVAIDPSSPFSGGAVMGDRIRMQDHAGDGEVFIRSLGTRGSHGGLSRATREVVKLYDAYGMDEVIVETVGVGQTELDIMAVAQTTVVVLTPESGDTVQTMKAGLIEIADVVVVNKADRQGAEGLAATIEGELQGRDDTSWWMPPVLLTRAHRGLGLEELLRAIGDHREQAEKTSNLEQRRSERRRRQFARAVRDAVDQAVGGLDMEDGTLGEIVARVERGEIDPDSAAAEAIMEGDLLSRLARDLGTDR